MSQYYNNLITMRKSCSSPCVSYVIFFITALIIWDKKAEQMDQICYIIGKYFLKYYVVSN